MSIYNGRGWLENINSFRKRKYMLSVCICILTSWKCLSKRYAHKLSRRLIQLLIRKLHGVIQQNRVKTKDLLRYEESKLPMETKAYFLAHQQWIALKGRKMRWFRWKSIWKAFQGIRVKGPEDNEKKFHYDDRSGPRNAELVQVSWESILHTKESFLLSHRSVYLLYLEKHSYKVILIKYEIHYLSL